MPLDVVDLRGFYSSRLGKVAGRFIASKIRERFANCVGLSVMGVG